MSPRRCVAAVVLAAGIVAASAGTASANPIDDNPNPGGGTVGLECVYLNDADPPELCQPALTPMRDITPPKVFRNPFPAIWHDLTYWW
jgi:hypothetical protein